MDLPVYYFLFNLNTAKGFYAQFFLVYFAINKYGLGLYISRLAFQSSIKLQPQFLHTFLLPDISRFNICNFSADKSIFCKIAFIIRIYVIGIEILSYIYNFLIFNIYTKLDCQLQDFDLYFLFLRFEGEQILDKSFIIQETCVRHLLLI